MSYNKKIKKIVDRMSDNKSKNKKIMLRNILKIEKESKESFPAREAVLTTLYSDKILEFMRTNLEILNNDSVFGGPEKIRGFLGLNLGDFNSIPPLLHTIIDKYYIIEVIEMILDLVDNSFDKGLATHNQYVYELIYKYNVIGQDFVSYFLARTIKYNRDKTQEVDSLIRIINKYSIDLSLCDVAGDNALKFLDKIETSTEHLMRPAQIKELKQCIYKNSVISLLTFDKENDLEMINSIFGDINYHDDGGSLLHYCFKYPSFLGKDIIGNVDKFILKRVYYLLSLGIDPNLKDKDGKSFVEVAIDVSDDIDYAFCRDIINLPDLIREILVESNKYEYNILWCTSLFESILNKINTIGTAINVYLLLCELGYNSYHFRMDYRKAEEKLEKQKDIDITDLNFLNLYYFNLQRDLLLYLLKREKLAIEDNFIEKYNNILCPELNEIAIYSEKLSFNDYNEFIKYLMEFFGMTYIEEYFTYLVDTIVKLRNESILVQNNKITVKEFLEAINYTIVNKEQELNNVNVKFKEKQLIYEYIRKLRED